MPTRIEQEPLPKGLEERAEEISPLTIEQKEVVTPTTSQFKAQVTDDNGRPLIQTPPASAISVSVPADSASLQAWGKGSTEDSLTWWAYFWQRIIKKALHFGWRIIGRS